jgi:hypothetical protein
VAGLHLGQHPQPELADEGLQLGPFGGPVGGRAAPARMRRTRKGSATAPRPSITSVAPLTARQRRQSSSFHTSPLATTGTATTSAMRPTHSQWAGGR